MWATDKKGNSTDIGCGNFDLPDDTELEINNGNKSDCQQWWAIVGTEIPGDNNFLMEHIRPDIDCCEKNTQENHQKFPWSAPGTAPVVSPCGAMGADCAKLRLKETTVSLKNAFKMSISNSLAMSNGSSKIMNTTIRNQQKSMQIGLSSK